MKNVIAIACVVGAFAIPEIGMSGTANAHDQLAYNRPEPVSASIAPAMDLAQLEARLRETSAMGFWSKLQLEGRLDDILASISRHRDGAAAENIEAIREQFYILADETAAKLKRGDPSLSNAIARSRDAIWEAFLQR